MTEEYYALIGLKQGELSFLVYDTEARLLRPLNNPDIRDDYLFHRVKKLESLNELKEFNKKYRKI